ncbi:unnamed protein product [Ceutorhynchus assimilis]|uniref:MORN repeat-containing protein 3 n=1 Tax=Ceutorhynchus assimilis TaxID=467358 RepID=A0A9N9MYL9_9CUCU|nr:unnamed protein product [Ceutorhynchus assimilis]
MPFLKASNYKIGRSRVLENTTKRNGLRHTYFNLAGDKYIGEWKDDKKDGKGLIITRNNELYEGEMKNNFRHGFGILAHLIPDTKGVYVLHYRGEWRNGRMHGEGLKIFPDGSFYMGAFRCGKRHGRGQMFYAIGAFFDGEFKNDVREGTGIMVEPNGNRFEGSWKNNFKHGEGLYYHLDSGQVQEGVWQKDMCVYSTMRDIIYRQCALRPTTYPIPDADLKISEQKLQALRERALAGIRDSCNNIVQAIRVPDMATLRSSRMGTGTATSKNVSTSRSSPVIPDIRSSKSVRIIYNQK